MISKIYPTYTSPNEKFEYGFPHSNALLLFCLELERCKPHKAVHHPKKCDVINYLKLFAAGYRRIYCCIFFDVTNYKSKCIRMNCYK